MTDERGVTWGRYDAEHRALLDRVAEVERFTATLRNAETIHAEILARIGELEAAGRDKATREHSRRDRLWVIVLTVMSGVVAPLVVTSVLAWIHLRATR
jgi:hypothetical protein